MIPTERLLRLLIWLLIAAVSVFLFERMLALAARFSIPLLLFALAWLIALVLQPFIAWITGLTIPMPLLSWWRAENGAAMPTWRLPRGLAVLLVYLAVLAVLVYLVISLVPVITTQLASLESTLPDANSQIDLWAQSLQKTLNEMGWRVDFASVLQTDTLLAQATGVGSTLIAQSLTIVSGIANVLINLVLVLILSFYMTLDGPRLATRLMDILPNAWRADTVTLFAIINRTFGGFLRAQVLQSVVYGLATAVLMVSLGLSDVALASVLSSVLVLIPLIGGVFAMVPPLVIVLIESPDRFLLTLIGLIVIQQVLFNMIMPRLMGQIIGLHPLLVFAAFLIGAALAGAWGILFGVPVAGVIASILQFLYIRATASAEGMATETPVAH